LGQRANCKKTYDLDARAKNKLAKVLKMTNYPEGADNEKAPWNAPDVPDITVMMAENELHNDLKLFECFLENAIDVNEPCNVAGMPPMISTIALFKLMLAKCDVSALQEIRRRYIAGNQDFINQKIKELME
jgi:hypothetical protein